MFFICRIMSRIFFFERKKELKKKKRKKDRKTEREEEMKCNEKRERQEINQ